MRTLTSHQCGAQLLGTALGPGIISGLSLLLVLFHTLSRLFAQTQSTQEWRQLGKPSEEYFRSPQPFYTVKSPVLRWFPVVS